MDILEDDERYQALIANSPVSDDNIETHSIASMHSEIENHNDNATEGNKGLSDSECDMGDDDLVDDEDEVGLSDDEGCNPETDSTDNGVWKKVLGPWFPLSKKEVSGILYFAQMNFKDESNLCGSLVPIGCYCSGIFRRGPYPVV
jgi:hypothetical protein